MDAFVLVFLVVAGESGQDAEFDLGSIAVFLNRPNHLDGALGALGSIVGLHHLSKRALAE